MSYGLTIYGPLEETDLRHQAFIQRVGAIFFCTYDQIETAWATMINYPDFNHVDITRRHDGDLVIHVYDTPADAPTSVFHAKISPGGTYA